MPRFAANLSMMFIEVPFLDRFAAAAQAGFGAVEFLFPYDHAPSEIAARLEANGLTQALFNLPPGNWAAGERGIAVFPARFEELKRGTETALNYARATGAKRLHLMAGMADREDPAAAEAYRGAVLWTAERLGQEGLDLLLEPINARSMPGYFLSDFRYARDLIGDLAVPNLKLQFDIFHRQILHGDVTVALGDMMPIIGHVQVASVPERHEPTTGELNDAFLFSEIDRLGYDGFVGCEYLPRASTRDGLGWFDAWRGGRS